jgi:BirA family biotin operon repressor/biotin-[acetyl-CoA-carboxylase] ligase
VTAERQSAGRGRRARTWISQPGNLYASLLLTRRRPVERWPQLSFVAALAIHDAVVGDRCRSCVSPRDQVAERLLA